MTRLFRTQLADGIMGVNNDPRKTIIDAYREHHQLHRDIFSLCFGKYGGRFNVGGYNTSEHVDEISWTPYLPSATSFLVTLEAVHANSKAVQTHAEHNALVDTGTTFTYVTRHIGDFILEALDGIEGLKAHEASRRVDPDSIRCYTMDSSIFDLLPPILLQLGGGVALAIPPSQYIFPKDDGHMCIGIFIDSRQVVLGMNTFQDFDVIFDRVNTRIGFARSRCGQIDPACGNEDCFLSPYEEAKLKSAQNIVLNRPVAIRAFLSRAPSLFAAYWHALEHAGLESNARGARSSVAWSTPPR